MRLVTQIINELGVALTNIVEVIDDNIIVEVIDDVIIICRHAFWRESYARGFPPYSYAITRGRMFWREEISCRTFCRSSHLPSNTPLTLTATLLTSA